jgi:hypothetical protein
VAQIQKDIQRIRAVPTTKAKIRKPSSKTEPRSKINKARKGKRSRWQQEKRSKDKKDI